jgi:hypothetical protein
LIRKAVVIEKETLMLGCHGNWMTSARKGLGVGYSIIP